MSDSTTAVGAPAVGARIFAFTIAVCAVAVTPAIGVGALAMTVEGRVPGKMVEMIEPEPLAKGMLTEVVTTAEVDAPGVLAFPRTSAKAKEPESVAVLFAGAPGGTIETAITRQMLSLPGSATAPTKRAEVKLKSEAPSVEQFTSSSAVKTNVIVREVELAASATNDTTCGAVVSSMVTETVAVDEPETLVAALWARSSTENAPEIASEAGLVVP